MAKLSNPLAFTRGPVTFISTLIYAGLIIALIVTQTIIPSVPSKLPKGVNVTEAWLDLQQLTSAYRPFNSRRNDYVRDWLLLRIESILAENTQAAQDANTELPSAYVFNDLKSNLTFNSLGSTTSPNIISVYFESTNIIVYIRGSQDDQTEWWKDSTGKPHDDGGVLVNAHYDSVSTGYGATDDGVGVVSVLQLIKHYTTPGNAPKKGLVALLNNGEEDFLNGARVFSQHPLSKFPHTFLNLEGAGAGGKATLFRSTDTEVTKAYRNSPYPFGTVVSDDGFQRGLVRSQTDYIVFNGILGLRGLDVAFFEPRARYHTDEDDTRHTSKASLWHMLSAAIATTKKLTSDTSSTFTGDPEKKGGVAAGTGSKAVWFDILGQAFVVFQLHTLFAFSVTLLVVAPIFLLTTMIILHQVDKFYLFSGSKKYQTADGDESVPLYGWRGFFRFPLLFLISCAAPVALAYLLFKMNPYIAHSSEWSVWSMMFSSFVFVAWFLARAADYVRPSAFTRAYCLLWMFIAWWAILVADTVFENQLKLAGGYFVLFFFTGIFLATWISLVELFALPRKSTFCQGKFVPSRRGSGSSSQLLSGSRAKPSGGRDNKSRDVEGEEEGEDATEESALLNKKKRTTFANYGREETDDEPVEVTQGNENAEDENPEQDWSENLPSWIWVLQFLLIAPFVIITIGEIALLVVAGLHQTGSDGNSMFFVYIVMALFTILILSPLAPFIHRFTWHVPMFLFLVLIGTLIYNVIAFPFSDNNRLKLFFKQEVDFDSGINNVSFVGLPGFVQEAIDSLPSAAGQEVNCVPTTPGDRQKCSWHGLPPRVVDPSSKLPPETQYRTWLSFNVSRAAEPNSARFMLFGKKTRACRMLFNSDISSFEVHGSSPADKRFPSAEGGGIKEIRLWSRTWGRPWTVDVHWEGGEDDKGKAVGLSGKIVCLWSDANHDGVIPALDEAHHFTPGWVAVTKADDGLVEGFKRFMI